MFIGVTRRVKGYIVFVEKYVKGVGKRFQTYKVYLFFMRVTNQVVWPSARTSVWTLRDRKLQKLDSSS